MTGTRPISFHSPHITGKELVYIAEACVERRLSGDGRFTRLCNEWIEQRTGAKKALLTHSCTAALEMAALLLDIEKGDEIIMPSYTFVSTASAFVLRGGVPIFVDIRPDTLNIDERLIEAAISPRTRAIAPVHYAGISCDMDAILEIAGRRRLAVVEDAAQGVGATYKNRPLGSMGALGAYSFHETKNLVSGEGGALLVNDPMLAPRAEIIREKGTDRSRFLRGEVDKYTWREVGSSFLPSELVAAFLWAQFEEADAINSARMACWLRYHEMLEPLEAKGRLQRPVVPDECRHNGHIYYILLPSAAQRPPLVETLRKEGIGAAFHYVPLHSSPAGKKYGRSHGRLPVTEDLAERILRLPLSAASSAVDQQRVAAVLEAVL